MHENSPGHFYALEYENQFSYLFLVKFLVLNFFLIFLAAHMRNLLRICAIRCAYAETTELLNEPTQIQDTAIIYIVQIVFSEQ